MELQATFIIAADGGISQVLARPQEEGEAPAIPPKVQPIPAWVEVVEPEGVPRDPETGRLLSKVERGDTEDVLAPFVGPNPPEPCVPPPTRPVGTPYCLWPQDRPLSKAEFDALRASYQPKHPPG